MAGPCMQAGGGMRNVIRQAKRVVKAIVGKDFFPTIDIAVKTERFGSVYGGWDVAIEDINKNSVIYSFGVGEDISFDVALIEKYNLTVHAFDPTPKSIEWIESGRRLERFIMHGYGLANIDGNVSFNPPENPDHVSHTILNRPGTEDRSITVPMKRLVTIMEELRHTHIDLLKMDIEGAEYGVIEDLAQASIRPGQILVEFHHRFPGVGIQKSKEAIETLRRIGYALFSVSSTGEEFSFILHKN